MADGSVPPRVHVVVPDPVLYERLAAVSRRWKDLDIRLFPQPPAEETAADLWVLPAELLAGFLGGGSRPRPAVIGYGGARLLRRAFLTGCEDYLREPWDPDELECRVRRLAGRLERCLEFSWGRVSLRDGSLTGPGGSVPLTPQERIILKTLLLHRGEVIPRQALFYAIWGRVPERESRAVDMQVSNLRRKLSGLLPGGGDCIEPVRNQGYRFSSR